MGGRGRLHGLHVEGFKLLGDVHLELGRLNVLVGPNASGKSTILEVIQLLGDAARTNLADAVASHGGFTRIHTRRTSARTPERDVILLEVKAIVTQFAHEGALDEYSLEFSPSKPGVVQVEHFTFKRTKRQGRRITLSNGRLSVQGEKRTRQLAEDAFGLAVLPYLAPEEGGAELRKIQEIFTTFRVFDVDVARAREPSRRFTEGEALASDAANLAGFLLELRDMHPEAYARLVADARRLVPGLEDIKIVDYGEPQRVVALELSDARLEGHTPLRDASFGVVRVLALLAMLHDPAPPLLTCIEELDHGLHPWAFDLLVERLREASQRTQFVIATHSPALVNRLRADELIVCERDSVTGTARIPAIPRETVKAMMEESVLSAGELWFSGALGGIPHEASPPVRSGSPAPAESDPTGSVHLVRSG